MTSSVKKSQSTRCTEEKGPRPSISTREENGMVRTLTTVRTTTMTGEPLVVIGNTKGCETGMKNYLLELERIKFPVDKTDPGNY